MKSYFILIILLVVSPGIAGQEVIATAGETGQVSGYSVSWTLGETVIETGTSGGNSLTQGYHQPRLTVTPVRDFTGGKATFAVYPNPARDFVMVRVTPRRQNSSAILFNFAGEKLMESDLQGPETRLSLQKQAPGAYLLKLVGEKDQPLRTFKIIKR